MSQAYREIIGSDLLGESYPYINGMTAANRTDFSGPTEPVAPVAYQLWNDTTLGLKKMRSGANDSWITIGVLGADFLGLLSRAGGIMTGAIDMGGFSVTNVGLGTGAAAARQQEVDAKAPIAAPAFTGDATVNQDPFGNDSLIRRIWAEGRYAKLSGATMTGALNLFGNASNALEAVPRQQLAAFTDFNTGSGHRHSGADARKVLGTDIDAAGSTSGQYFRSTGSGTAPAWQTVTPTFVFRNPPDTVINHSGVLPTTFQSVDVTSVTNANARGIVLNFSGPVLTQPILLRLRRLGDSNDTDGMTVSLQPGVSDFRIAIVEVDSGQVFQWRALVGINDQFKAYLVGYFGGF